MERTIDLIQSPFSYHSPICRARTSRTSPIARKQRSIVVRHPHSHQHTHTTLHRRILQCTSRPRCPRECLAAQGEDEFADEPGLLFAVASVVTDGEERATAAVVEVASYACGGFGRGRTVFLVSLSTGGQGCRDGLGIGILFTVMSCGEDETLVPERDARACPALRDVMIISRESSSSGRSSSTSSAIANRCCLC